MYISVSKRNCSDNNLSSSGTLKRQCTYIKDYIAATVQIGVR